MLPRIGQNFTIVHSLYSSSPGDHHVSSNLADKTRDQLSQDIYDQQHNKELPRIVGAISAADMAIKFVNQAKTRQDYYYDRAINFHRERYGRSSQSGSGSARAPRKNVSYLIPIGQNFGYPEKRCFDFNLSRITCPPRHGDGVILDTRVGDLGQAPPGNIRQERDEVEAGKQRVLDLKNLRWHSGFTAPPQPILNSWLCCLLSVYLSKSVHR